MTWWPPTEMESLIDLIKDNCVKRGKFTLSSGMETDYLIDLKPLLLEASSSSLIGWVIQDEIRKRWDASTIQGIGGMELGAIPLAMATMLQWKAFGFKPSSFIVRKEAKTHGNLSSIEWGRHIPLGARVLARVLILEDVTTTGHNAFTAHQRVMKEGRRPVGIVSLVDRSLADLERGNVENARSFFRDQGIAFLPIIPATLLI